MDIKLKGPSSIRKTGKTQLCVVFKKDIVEASGISEKDKIDITVLSNGSILIEKSKQ